MILPRKIKTEKIVYCRLCGMEHRTPERDCISVICWKCMPHWDGKPPPHDIDQDLPFADDTIHSTATT